MPPKPPRKADLSMSTHPPHLRAGSSTSTSEAVSKVASDGIMPVSANRGDPDFSASSYDDASPLHFHGLAVTQTQTQVASCAEASGKGSVVSEARVIKRRKVCHSADVLLPCELPSKALNVVSGTKSTSRSPSKLKRRRSPSVDSFAEAEEWEDPAKGFLAANRKFEIPLSELGRGTTQEDDREDKHPMVPRSPPAPVLHQPTQTDLPSSPRRPPDSGSRHKRRNRRSGAQDDDVLSPESNVSLGAPGRDDTQENEIPDVPDNASTPPLVSNPGSLEYMDTQVEDYQSTQPLASEDLDADTTQVSDIGVPHVGQSSPQEYMNSRPSSNTRNILGMVNPMKKWRHQQGQLLQQHAATDCVSDGQTQPTADFSKPSYTPSTGRRLYEQLAAQMYAEPHSSGQHDHNDLGLPAIDEDSRETAVVPDSEPADTSPSPSRPKPSTPQDDPPLESPPPQPVVRDKLLQPGERTDAQTDDDDDDDVPLVLTIRHQAPRVDPLAENAGDLPKAKSSRNRSERAPKIKVSRARGTDAGDKEIPSSVPERDHQPTLVSSRPPTSPRTNSRRKGKRRNDAVEDIPIPDPPPRIVASTPDKDTESADDLPLEAEDDVPAPRDSKVQLPLNRRRLPTVPVRKAGHRSAAREGSKTPSFASTTRAIKRNKGHQPTVTQVYALWKQAAAYFSGTVWERVGPLDRFKIHFDDGDEDVVDVKNLRRLELRVGDRVSVIESQEKATVVNVDGQNYGTVVVQSTDEPTDEFEVKVIGIKIQSRAINAQWGDRTINSDEIMLPTKSETPSSLRNPSTGLNKKKALAKVGIVVTLSVGSYRGQEKESFTRVIRSIGGTVLDDWSDIFSLAGEYSSNRKRWVITGDSIGTETKLDIQQVFLVSDDASAKPRYLTALALGIPCVSITWLEAMSSGQCTVTDWPNYLLPAGYSDTLGARVTQIVDLDWGTTLDHLTGIMSNKVPTKLFSNMSILVLGPEYFPPPAKGKKGISGVGDEKSNDGRFIPRIIVSMGAARVEAVPELKYASSPDLKDFQYVVVKELHERPPVGGEKYVSMEWVKDCLIAGRMVPPRG